MRRLVAALALASHASAALLANYTGLPLGVNKTSSASARPISSVVFPSNGTHWSVINKTTTIFKSSTITDYSTITLPVPSGSSLSLSPVTSIGPSAIYVTVYATDTVSVFGPTVTITGPLRVTTMTVVSEHTAPCNKAASFSPLETPASPESTASSSSLSAPPLTTTIRSTRAMTSTFTVVRVPPSSASIPSKVVHIPSYSMESSSHDASSTAVHSIPSSTMHSSILDSSDSSTTTMHTTITRTSRLTLTSTIFNTSSSSNSDSSTTAGSPESGLSSSTSIVVKSSPSAPPDSTTRLTVLLRSSTTLRIPSASVIHGYGHSNTTAHSRPRSHSHSTSVILSTHGNSTAKSLVPIVLLSSSSASSAVNRPITTANSLSTAHGRHSYAPSISHNSSSKHVSSTKTLTITKTLTLSVHSSAAPPYAVTTTIPKIHHTSAAYSAPSISTTVSLSSDIDATTASASSSHWTYASGNPGTHMRARRAADTTFTEEIDWATVSITGVDWATVSYPAPPAPASTSSSESAIVLQTTSDVVSLTSPPGVPLDAAAASNALFIPISVVLAISTTTLVPTVDVTELSLLASATPTPESFSSSLGGSIATSTTLATLTTRRAMSAGATKLVSAPTPSASLCGESGDFTLTWDDEPAYTPSKNDSRITHPPVFNPYHKFFFASGYGYVNQSQEPFKAASAPTIAIYGTDSADQQDVGSPGAGSTLLRPGEIGAGPRAPFKEFWFNGYAANFGCLVSKSQPSKSFCHLAAVGYRWEPESQQDVAHVQQEFTIPTCQDSTGCELKRVQFTDPGFRNISGIQFTVFDPKTVTRLEKSLSKTYYDFLVDNLDMGWADNSCAAGLMRISARK